MSKHIVSEHAVVAKAPYELYMSFVDMRNFAGFIPEQYRTDVEADYDSITGTVQGIRMGIKVFNRVPYSRLDFVSKDSPLEFSLSLFFDATGAPSTTDFHIEMDANLNMMMSMMIGGRLKKALDQIVKMLADAAQGRYPEGFDPKEYARNL